MLNSDSKPICCICQTLLDEKYYEAFKEEQMGLVCCGQDCQDKLWKMMDFD